MKKNLVISFWVLLSVLECNDVFCVDAFAGFTADHSKKLRFNVTPTFLQKPKSMLEHKLNATDIRDVENKSVSNGILNQKRNVKSTTLGRSINYSDTGNGFVKSNLRHGQSVPVDSDRTNFVRTIDLKLINNVNLKSVNLLSWNFIASPPKVFFKEQHTFRTKVEGHSLKEDNVKDMPILSSKSNDRESTLELKSSYIIKHDKPVDDLTVYAPNIPVSDMHDSSSLSFDNIKNKANVKKEDAEKLLIDVDKELNKSSN